MRRVSVIKTATICVRATMSCISNQTRGVNSSDTNLWFVGIPLEATEGIAFEVAIPQPALSSGMLWWTRVANDPLSSNTRLEDSG